MLCLHKIVEALIRHRQSHGLRAMIYLDDGIVAAKGCENAMHQSMRVQSYLANTGLVVNDSKSQLVPTSVLFG